MARGQGSVVPGILVQNPQTHCLAFSPEGVVLIFNSHLHGEHGALIATASDRELETVGRFLGSLLGIVADSHLCWLTI